VGGESSSSRPLPAARSIFTGRDCIIDTVQCARQDIKVAIDLTEQKMRPNFLIRPLRRPRAKGGSHAPCQPNNEVVVSA
jgi:hypothetical protein